MTEDAKALSPRHAAARALAAAGIPVLPCDGKRANCGKGGLHNRTTDLEQIDRWWATGDWNVAIVPEDQGLCVIDVDRKNGGYQTLWSLNLPPTRVIDTPSYGVHLYFKGSLPSSVEKLGAGIDTRGRDSYVLVPPSVIDDRMYREWTSCPEPATLPAWVSEKLYKAPREQPDTQADLTAPLEDIERWLADIPNDDLSWEDWNNMLMAIYAASDGSEDGLSAACAWSAKSNKHDSDAVYERWENFAISPPKRIGAGTLRHLAKLARWGADSEKPTTETYAIPDSERGRDPF
jgi:hypothetical protein